jgi:hypothetical protein
VATPPKKPEEEKEMEERKVESAQADQHARMHTPKQVSEHASIEQELRDRILVKRHLSSFSFRFRTEELEELDRIADEINHKTRHKTTKNDIVRLALKGRPNVYTIKLTVGKRKNVDKSR